MTVSSVRQEILDYIDAISDNKLEALKPLLTILARDSSDDYAIETDLTEEEIEIIRQGELEYESGARFYTIEEVFIDSRGAQCAPAPESEMSEDPFYSEANMARLRNAVADMKAGRNMTEHELIEVEDNKLEITQCGSHYRDK
jgi:hypothetical protein